MEAPRPTGKWRYRGPLDRITVGDTVVERDEVFEPIDPLQLPAGAWEIVDASHKGARKVRSANSSREA